MNSNIFKESATNNFVSLIHNNMQISNCIEMSDKSCYQERNNFGSQQAGNYVYEPLAF